MSAAQFDDATPDPYPTWSQRGPRARAASLIAGDLDGYPMTHPDVRRTVVAALLWTLSAAKSKHTGVLVAIAPVKRYTGPFISSLLAGQAPSVLGRACVGWRLHPWWGATRTLRPIRPEHVVDACAEFAALYRPRGAS